MENKFSLDKSKKVFPIILMVIGLGIMVAQLATRQNLVGLVSLLYCCIMSAVIFLSLIIKKKVYLPMVLGYAFSFIGLYLFHVIWGADAGFGAFCSGLAGWSSADNAMRGNRILNNEIYRTSQVLCDAGGIYTLSKQPDSEISGNYIHDIHLPEWADYATSGIYMDEQTAGYTVEYNVIEHGWGVGRNRNGENNYREKTIYIDKNWNPIISGIKKNAGIKDYFDMYAKLFY